MKLYELQPTTTGNAPGLDLGTFKLYATGVLTFTPAAATPVINSRTTDAALIGTPYSYTITATNSPTTFGATSLPGWVSFNSTTGLISGTPTASGPVSIGLSATNASGTGTATLTLTVNASPTATTQPTSVSVQEVSGASFAAAASGYPSPSAQWQVSSDGGTTFSNLTDTGGYSGSTTNILTLASTTLAMSGSQYRAVFTNSSGSANTTVATLVVTAASAAPVVSQQPSSAVTVVGGMTSFSASASGASQPTVQWQASVGGGAFGNLANDSNYSGVTGTTLIVSDISLAMSGNQYRAVFTNPQGSATSSAATLTVNSPPAVVTQPVSSTAIAGNTAMFTVVPSGSPTPAVQWQLSTDSGVTFGDLVADATYSGITTNTLSVANVGTAMDGQQFRALLHNGIGNDVTTDAVTLSVLPPAPVITSATAVAGEQNVAFSFSITADNGPTSFSAAPLPPGLSLNTVSGLISGTPTSVGMTSVAISATNVTGAAHGILSITINPPAALPPVINSALTATATAGSAFSYAISASNTPTRFGAIGLPAGLSVNSSTGVISGTPAAAGSSNVTISAGNGAGSETTTLVLTVNAPAPVINSALTASGTVGASFTYTISATNSPASFGASNLPGGLSLDATTGVISGSPSAAGAFGVSISATNVSGSGTSTLVITVKPAAPVITSPTSATATSSRSFSYQITATNSPTGFGATDLPTGLQIDSATGLISGTPTTAGNYSVGLTATNAGGTGTVTLALTVNNAPPTINSPTTASGTAGVAFSYLITATNSPTGFGATGLPPGLAVDTAAGQISGTPTTAGTYNATISATNPSGTYNRGLQIVINPPPPVIPAGLSVVGIAGQPFTFTIPASNNPTSFAATGLPDGLALDTTTGIISGAPAAAGTSVVAISATNAHGTGGGTLHITINPALPAINSPRTTAVTIGGTLSYAITASEKPGSYDATGLPAGLFVDKATGVISGTPTVIGVSTFTISATNITGTGTARLTLTVNARTSRLINLSVRGQCLTGDNALIPSFAIAGSGTKKMLVRVSGPTLSSLGVPGAISDPVLDLRQLVAGGSIDVGDNNDWGSNANSPEIVAVGKNVGAFPLPIESRDAALLVSLGAGNYSAITGGLSGVTGVGLVELYDTDDITTSAGVTNLSARGLIGTGDSVMIFGFVISSEAPLQVLVRVVGPTLGQAPFNVAGVLADPQLVVQQYDTAGPTYRVITSNDNWWADAHATDVAAAAVKVGAFALPTGSKDAAVLVTLDPGRYTVQASGVGNSTGLALVEIYAVPRQ